MARPRLFRELSFDDACLEAQAEGKLLLLDVMGAGVTRARAICVERIIGGRSFIVGWLSDALVGLQAGNVVKVHIVKEIRGQEILIGNNIGKINGWAGLADIVGVVTEVED